MVVWEEGLGLKASTSVLLALLVGCAQGVEAPVSDREPAPETETSPTLPATTPPVVTVEPAWGLPDGAEAFGVMEFRIRTDVPATLTLHIEDICGSRTLSFEGASTDHRVPVAGLHIGGVHHVEAELVSDEGTLVHSLGGTVREAWSVSYEELLTFAMGDVDVLDSGQVLMAFSSTESLPLQSRLVQLDPERPDDPSLDVEFTDGNRYTYRAEVVPGFDLPSVSDSRR